MPSEWEEIIAVGTLLTVGLMFATLAVYRGVQFFVGVWQGIKGIEPTEPRGFEVQPPTAKRTAN